MNQTVFVMINPSFLAALGSRFRQSLYAGLFLGMGLVAGTHAATVTVTTTVDVVDGNTSSLAALQANPGGAGISLREAVLAINNDTTGPHTINIPAGTYTLTIAGLDDTAAAGDLDIKKAVTITGAGSASTVIRAGTTASNGIDKIFSCNPLGNLPGFPVTISGVTLRFGAMSIPAWPAETMSVAGWISTPASARISTARAISP